MARPETRLWYRAFATVAIVVLAVTVVVQLERSRPLAPSKAIVEGVADLAVEEPLSCRRRVSEGDVAPPTSEGRATSTALVECPFRFDRQRVTYVGEVVGDVLRRDGGAWVLLNDDPYALEVGPLPAGGEFAGFNSGVSVWLDGDLADLVDRPGGPEWRGAVLRIEGIVHRTDPADGGGLTIRADTAELLAPAARLRQPVHLAQALAAAVFAALAGGAVAWRRYTQRIH
ncbi:MAG: hypothetical protein R3320_03130 [Nitriliruptorales bacterium]|nr:hypothetical protein [Nitriliruptorales bacterium]